MNSRPNTNGRIVQGDCVQLMKRLPEACIDLVVTDPPYLVNYRSRDGRTIPNDRAADWLRPAFAEIYRVMKPNTFCVCFYGWNRVDLFMDAWKRAGLTPAGHIVWQKQYASNTSFLAACHEQAYLLVKGHPFVPRSNAMRDVLPWQYSGNYLHPTQKPEIAIEPLVRALSRPGQVVLDPFAGSGTTAVVARKLGRRYLAFELDPEYFKIAQERLAQQS